MVARRREHRSSFNRGWANKSQIKCIDGANWLVRIRLPRHGLVSHGSGSHGQDSTKLGSLGYGSHRDSLLGHGSHGDSSLRGLSQGMPRMALSRLLVVGGLLFGSLLLMPLHPAVAEDSPDKKAITETAANSLPRTPVADRDAPRILRDPAALGLRALADTLPEAEVLWLEGKEFDPQAAMALYLPANAPSGSRRVQGGVLLLHDRGQHPDWPHITGHLRKAMPATGWHTLSLALFYPEHTPVPERTLLARSATGFPYADAIPREGRSVTSAVDASIAGETDPESSADTADDSAADAQSEPEAEVEGIGPRDYELSSEVDIDASNEPVPTTAGVESTSESEPSTLAKGISNNQRIELGLQQLASLGMQNRSVIGVGEGATQLLNYLLENPQRIANLQGMIWINARFDQALLSRLQTQVPAWATIKTLDIYDSTQVALKQAAQQRKDFARRNHPSAFQSSPMPGLALNQSRNSQRLLNQVWSWHKRVMSAGQKRSR